MHIDSGVARVLHLRTVQYLISFTNANRLCIHSSDECLSMWREISIFQNVIVHSSEPNSCYDSMVCSRSAFVKGTLINVKYIQNILLQSFLQLGDYVLSTKYMYNSICSAKCSTTSLDLSTIVHEWNIVYIKKWN